MFIVVIAEPESGIPNAIYKGEDINRLLANVSRYYKKGPDLWSREMDDYLRAHQLDGTRAEVAATMSELFDKHISRSMVCGRCWRLGLKQKRPRR